MEERTLKEIYERTDLEIIRFNSMDVISTSIILEEDELPFVPKKNN